MRLYNVIAQAEAQACALTGWLGSKERLKYFITDVFGHSFAIVGHPDFNSVFRLLCDHGNRRGILRWGGLFFLFHGVEGIVEQVQDHPPDFLGNDFYFPYGVIVFGFNDCVEGFVPIPQAVIRQADILIGQGIDIRRFCLPVTAAAVLQHAFDDTIGTLAMVCDLFQVLFQVPGDRFCF